MRTIKMVVSLYYKREKIKLFYFKLFIKLKYLHNSIVLFYWLNFKKIMTRCMYYNFYRTYCTKWYLHKIIANSARIRKQKKY